VTPLSVRDVGGRVRFAVRIQPRAKRSEVVGVHGEALKIRLSAPPVDGAANQQLVNFLADIFAVSRRDIRIVAGESSRSKVIEIDGVTERAVLDVAEGTGR
jgi:uncharacterized protein (TIGR00251 family)